MTTKLLDKPHDPVSERHCPSSGGSFPGIQAMPQDRPLDALLHTQYSAILLRRTPLLFVGKGDHHAG